MNDQIKNRRDESLAAAVQLKYLRQKKNAMGRPKWSTRANEALDLAISLLEARACDDIEDQ